VTSKGPVERTYWVEAGGGVSALVSATDTTRMTVPIAHPLLNLCMPYHLDYSGFGLPVECGESVGESRARVLGWKGPGSSDQVGVDAPIETCDTSVWAAPDAVRQMQ
jgi:hypothetical protein